MNADRARKIVDYLTSNNVLTAYSGKLGCMCGCRGTYRTSAQNRTEAEKDQGYGYDDADVNLGSVSRILNKIKAAARELSYVQDIDAVDRAHPCWNVADNLQYVTATVNENRIYVVYLTQACKDLVAIVFPE